MRIWERSIATQFICLMLLALLLLQAIGFLISWDERGHALREAYKGEFLSRAEAVAETVKFCCVTRRGRIFFRAEPF